MADLHDITQPPPDWADRVEAIERELHRRYWHRPELTASDEQSHRIGQPSACIHRARCRVYAPGIDSQEGIHMIVNSVLKNAEGWRRPQGRVSSARRLAAVLGMLALPLVAAGVAAVPAAAATTTYRVTATIGVGGQPQGVGVDPATDTSYVANQVGNSVSVIDGATGTVTATIGVGGQPRGVGVDPATNTIYVANSGGNSVSVIDGATGTVTATIGVGSRPQGVGVDPATDTIYVANQLSNSVSVIDGATGTVTATIGVGSQPYAAGVDPVTNTIYVADLGGDSVSVIDGATRKVTDTVGGVGPVPLAVAVDPVTNTVYVANELNGGVSVIDGATDTVTATIGVGTVPWAVGVDPATNTVYAVNSGDNSVSVIDGATRKVTETVGVGSDPQGMGVDPATHAVYVADLGGDSVSVIAPLTAPDLSLSDTAQASVNNGQRYSYTLVAAGTGGSAAAGVTVTDALPGSVHIDSAAATKGSCTSSGSPTTLGGTVSCEVGRLAAGRSVTVTIQVTADTPGTVSDSAAVTAGNVTADSDDSGSAFTTVQGS